MALHLSVQRDLNEESCPVPEATLSQLRASRGKPDTADIALTLPAPQRAALAYFCYRRQHLKELAIELITATPPEELQAHFGGLTGTVMAQAAWLRTQSRAK